MFRIGRTDTWLAKDASFKVTNGSVYYIIVKRNRNELENERIKNILNIDRIL